VALLACIGFGAWVRIGTAFSLAIFDAARPQQMLQSDPALLYYITERIAEAGGLPPGDFRADARVEHPDGSDLPAIEAVGQEFLVAWSYLLLGRRVPLVAVCVIAMGIAASLAAVGVYGLARELTGSTAFAAFAAALFALTPANYRTLGFLLIREDLSLPLFALHLWWLARAARVRTAPACALAALALVAALATWHAMLFLALAEAGVLLAWFLRTGQNPLAAPRAGWFAVALALGSQLVPVLRAKHFLLSPPALVTWALLAAAWLERQWGAGRGATRVAALGALAAGLALAAALEPLWPGPFGEYGHVFELAFAKLRHLGELPRDPSSIPFGARLLWQGPFETGFLKVPLAMLGIAGVLLPVAVLTGLPGWLRGQGDVRSLLLLGFAGLSIALAIGVLRLVVVAGLVAPVALALLLRRVRGPTAAWAAGVLAIAAWTLAAHLRDYDAKLADWYPPQRQQELAETVDWIGAHVPPGEAIAGDFISSAAVLAHSRHRIVLQPKYETRRSRERIERFLMSLYHDSPARFQRLLRDEFHARYLLVDIGALWFARYPAGLPRDAPSPPAGSAAELLVRAELPDAPVPGFRLLYASSGRPPVFRLFEVLPAAARAGELPEREEQDLHRQGLGQPRAEQPAQRPSRERSGRHRDGAEPGEREEPDALGLEEVEAARHQDAEREQGGGGPGVAEQGPRPQARRHSADEREAGADREGHRVPTAEERPLRARLRADHLAHQREARLASFERAGPDREAGSQGESERGGRIAGRRPGQPERGGPGLAAPLEGREEQDREADRQRREAEEGRAEQGYAGEQRVARASVGREGAHGEPMRERRRKQEDGVHRGAGEVEGRGRGEHEQRRLPARPLSGQARDGEPGERDAHREGHEPGRARGQRPAAEGAADQMQEHRVAGGKMLPVQREAGHQLDVVAQESAQVEDPERVVIELLAAVDVELRAELGGILAHQEEREREQERCAEELGSEARPRRAAGIAGCVRTSYEQNAGRGKEQRLRPELGPPEGIQGGEGRVPLPGREDLRPEEPGMECAERRQRETAGEHETGANVQHLASGARVLHGSGG
jgi:hypothetical protein